MIITINGMPGTGKTTLAKALARKYGLKFYSIGGLMRTIASFFGLTINEFGKIAERQKFVDLCIDKIVKNFIKDNAIVGGRLAWYFFPKSIKILLLCDLKISARRIFNERRKTEEPYKSTKEVEEKIKERMATDIKRYRKYYGIRNLYSIENYDIIIDTSMLNKREMVKVAMVSLERFI